MAKVIDTLEVKLIVKLSLWSAIKLRIAGKGNYDEAAVIIESGKSNG